MSTKLTKSFITLLLAGLAFNAQAHKPWLLPSSTVLDEKDAWITVDAAISEGLFDIDHQPLKLDGVIVTGPDGAPVAYENVNLGKLRNTFDLKLAKPGTYKISQVTQNVAGSYTIDGATKRFRAPEDSYAKEIPAGAKDVVISHQYNRLETFVTSGAPTQTVLKPSGVGLELVPLTHPNDMRTGDTARWRFLVDGKPAAHLAFSLIPGGVRYRGTLGEIRQSTDANGEISFALPAPGMYMVSAATPAMAPPVDGKPAPMPAKRMSYAATVEVLPQ